MLRKAAPPSCTNSSFCAGLGTANVYTVGKVLVPFINIVSAIIRTCAIHYHCKGYNETEKTKHNLILFIE